MNNEKVIEQMIETIGYISVFIQSLSNGAEMSSSQKNNLAKAINREYNKLRQIYLEEKNND